MDSNKYPKIDYDSIRQSYSLHDTITKTWGSENTSLSSSDNKVWRCRFHNEKFSEGRDFKTFQGKDGVWRFQCFSSSCGVTGDIIDFVRMTKSLRHNSEAAEWLAGNAVPHLPVQKQPPQVQTPKYYNNLIPVVQEFHTSMNGESVYWHKKGLDKNTIDFFKLGYCKKCPTHPDSPSFTIPYFYKKDLADIKHRLEFPNGSGKYRHHEKGMKNRLFFPENLFDLDEIPFSLNKPGEALLLEGEIKTMFFWQTGYRCAGIPGASSWQERWTRFFKHLDRVYLCLDMDVEQETLEKIAGDLKNLQLDVIRVTLPVMKPDDFFVKFGGTVDYFSDYLKYGRVL